MDPYSEDEFEEDEGGDFGERVMARAQGQLRHYNDVRWCEVREIGPVHSHPLYHSCRFSECR
jgi:hypothetical protein